MDEDDNGKFRLERVNPYKAELFLYRPWRPKVFFFQFEIIIHFLVSSLHFNLIPMLYGPTAIVKQNDLISGDIVFIRHNLTIKTSDSDVLRRSQR